MELTTILQVSGIILNTVGVVLIFFFGLSPMIRKDGALFVHQNRESFKVDKRHKKRQLYIKLALLGLWFCVLGGVLSVFGVIM